MKLINAWALEWYLERLAIGNYAGNWTLTWGLQLTHDMSPMNQQTCNTKNEFKEKHERGITYLNIQQVSLTNLTLICNLKAVFFISEAEFSLWIFEH